MKVHKEAWDGAFTSHIQCPHCNAIDYETTDYPGSLQRDGDTVETDCDFCGKPIVVTLSVTYEFATAPASSSVSAASRGGDDEGRE